MVTHIELAGSECHVGIARWPREEHKKLNVWTQKCVLAIIFATALQITKCAKFRLIMNHNSGFIIGIARKIHENPNRTLTKYSCKITLTAFNCNENLLRCL